MTRNPNYLRRRGGRVVVAGALANLPVAVSHEAHPEEDRSPHDLEGCLRVTVERTWDIEVPCTTTFDAPKRFAPMANPHNQCGPLLLEQVPVVTGSDYDSFMGAFNKRCNTLHVDDIEDISFTAAYNLLDSLDFQGSPWDENDLDRGRWMAKFDQRKRDRMALAYEKIPYATAQYLGEKDLSVKHEVLLKRNDPSWAARVIYAGNDEFNTVTGPACMVAMERLEQIVQTQAIGPVHFCTAYKKTDVQLAAYIADAPDLPEVLEGDYSANDREQRKRVHVLFDKFLSVIRMPRWFRKLLVDLNTFKVKSRAFGVRATLANQLPTGTTSTTVRNTLYNALMFAVACTRQRARGKALILGDDLLARVNKRMSLEQWVADVASFKMKLKAKRPTLQGEATFLSRRIILGEVPCMVPLLGKALARFNARAVYDEAKSHSQYMAGKSLSYAYEFRHVPFMRDFFLHRFVMEDRSRLDLDDLTWMAKTSGLDLASIVPAIKQERALVSDDQFRDWCTEFYGFGLCPLEEICEMVICSDEPIMVEHSIVSALSVDW